MLSVYFMTTQELNYSLSDASEGIWSLNSMCLKTRSTAFSRSRLKLTQFFKEVWEFLELYLPIWYSLAFWFLLLNQSSFAILKSEWKALHADLAYSEGKFFKFLSPCPSSKDYLLNSTELLLNFKNLVETCFCLHYIHALAVEGYVLNM